MATHPNKRLLDRALARTGQSRTAFAQSIGRGYVPDYVRMVITGERDSPEIMAAFDALVAQERAADEAFATGALALAA